MNNQSQVSQLTTSQPPDRPSQLSHFYQMGFSKVTRHFKPRAENLGDMGQKEGLHAQNVHILGQVDGTFFGVSHTG